MKAVNQSKSSNFMQQHLLPLELQMIHKDSCSIEKEEKCYIREQALPELTAYLNDKFHFDSNNSKVYL